MQILQTKQSSLAVSFDFRILPRVKPIPEQLGFDSEKGAGVSGSIMRLVGNSE
jgi:hypothetical protein